MAEVTSKAIQEIAPTIGGTPIRLIYITGVSAANSDTITVSDLTTVRGAYLISTTGTVGTLTFSTNVITITNGSTLTWSGLAWGT